MAADGTADTQGAKGDNGENFVVKPIISDHLSSDNSLSDDLTSLVPPESAQAAEPKTPEDLSALFTVPPTNDELSTPNGDAPPNLEQSSKRYWGLPPINPMILSKGEYKSYNVEISPQDAEDFKRDWFSENHDLIRPDGTTDLKPALMRIEREMEMRNLIGKYILGSEPILNDDLDTLTLKDRWLGLPARPITQKLTPQEAQAAFMAGKETKTPVNIVSEDENGVTVEIGTKDKQNLSDFWRVDREINAGIHNKDNISSEPNQPRYRGVMTKTPGNLPGQNQSLEDKWLDEKRQQMLRRDPGSVLKTQPDQPELSKQNLTQLPLGEDRFLTASDTRTFVDQPNTNNPTPDIKTDTE